MGTGSTSYSSSWRDERVPGLPPLLVGVKDDGYGVLFLVTADLVKEEYHVSPLFSDSFSSASPSLSLLSLLIDACICFSPFPI